MNDEGKRPRFIVHTSSFIVETGAFNVHHACLLQTVWRALVLHGSGGASHAGGLHPGPGRLSIGAAGLRYGRTPAPHRGRRSVAPHHGPPAQASESLPGPGRTRSRREDPGPPSSRDPPWRSAHAAGGGRAASGIS